MATHCFIPMLGKRLRALALDNCGAYAAGNNYVVTDGFITMTLSSEVEDGAEIIVKKANGQLCVNERLSSSFKRFTVEIEFCGVNPSLLSIVSNAKPYTDYAGDIAGFTIGEGTVDKRFSLELWSGLAGLACLPGQVDEASGYFLLPQVNAGVLGDITMDGENQVTFSVTGAYTRGGNQWGKGPWYVVRALPTPTQQTLTVTGVPTGGNFTLTFRGATTSPIVYNATAAAIDAALEALPTIGLNGVAVTGGPLPGSPVTITFGGVLAGTSQPLITATAAFTGGTAPTVGVTMTQVGTAGAASKLPNAIDPYDHLLMVDTALAPPPSACSPSQLVIAP